MSEVLTPRLVGFEIGADLFPNLGNQIADRVRVEIRKSSADKLLALQSIGLRAVAQHCANLEVRIVERLRQQRQPVRNLEDLMRHSL